MRFLCAGQTKCTADLLELPVGDGPLQRVTAVLLKAGVQLQTCLFFEDVDLAGGVRLSELVSRAIKDSEHEGDGREGSESDVSPLSGLERQTSPESPASMMSTGTMASLPRPRGSLPRQLPVWRVVGGESKQGIVVREGEGLDSEQSAERLAAGSLVEELQLSGTRLQYRKLSGRGPPTGWISTAVHGKELAMASVGYLKDIVGVRGSPVALLFPGEGCQHAQMLASESLKLLPEVRMLLGQAHRILGYDVRERCELVPEWLLTKTSYNQPLLFVASMAAFLILRSEQPDKVVGAGAVAGFGLGYYTALCAAGVLTFEDMLQLLRVRGEAMEEAEAQGSFLGLTLFGLSQRQVQALCRKVDVMEGAQDCPLTLAHEYFKNSFGIVGPEASIFRLADMAKDLGASLVKCNNAAVSSECHLMQPSLPKLEAALVEVLPRMASPSCQVWTTTGTTVFNPGCRVLDIVADLKTHLTAPVNWDKTIKAMSASGFKEFYDVGPSGFLQRMLGYIDPHLTCHMVEAVPKRKAGAARANRGGRVLAAVGG